MMAVALLAAALAGAITVAVHYRAEAAALRRQLRSAPLHPRSAVPPRLSSMSAALPSYGALHAEVTVFSARPVGELTQIVLSAHISGGLPNTSYALTGFDCAGSSGYETWAAGVTGADGTANLIGHAWTVSLRDEYWLYLSPSSFQGVAGRGLHGSFTTAGRFSAAPAGYTPCS